MTEAQYNIRQDSLEFIKRYVIYHALIQYRTSLLQVPGGPGIIPDFDTIDQVIIDTINDNATRLTELAQRYSALNR